MRKLGGSEHDHDVAAAPHWPQPFGIAWAILSLAFATLAILGIYLLTDSSTTHDFGSRVGYSALALSFSVLTVITLSRAGIRNIGVSRKVRSYTDLSHGRGLFIPSSRGGLLTLVALFTGAGMYGLSASAAHFFGNTEALLPSTQNGTGTALLAGGFGIAAIILALTVLILRRPSTIGLHPCGVLRSTSQWGSKRRSNASIFVPWEDITDVAAETLVVDTGWVAVHNPMIELRVGDDLAPDDRARYDGGGTITIQVYALAAEPNTLHSLMVHLHENQDDRALLGEVDAVELLRPPPLRERFRAARIQKAPR